MCDNPGLHFGLSPEAGSSVTPLTFFSSSSWDSQYISNSTPLKSRPIYSPTGVELTDSASTPSAQISSNEIVPPPFQQSGDEKSYFSFFDKSDDEDDNDGINSIGTPSFTNIFESVRSTERFGAISDMKGENVRALPQPQPPFSPSSPNSAAVCESDGLSEIDSLEKTFSSALKLNDNGDDDDDDDYISPIKPYNNMTPIMFTPGYDTPASQSIATVSMSASTAMNDSNFSFQSMSDSTMATPLSTSTSMTMSPTAPKKTMNTSTLQTHAVFNPSSKSFLPGSSYSQSNSSPSNDILTSPGSSSSLNSLQPASAIPQQTPQSPKRPFQQPSTPTKPTAVSGYSIVSNSNTTSNGSNGNNGSLQATPFKTHHQITAFNPNSASFSPRSYHLNTTIQSVTPTKTLSSTAMNSIPLSPPHSSSTNTNTANNSTTFIVNRNQYFNPQVSPSHSQPQQGFTTPSYQRYSQAQSSSIPPPFYPKSSSFVHASASPSSGSAASLPASSSQPSVGVSPASSMSPGLSGASQQQQEESQESRRTAQRTKQIGYGMNTLGYKNLNKFVPQNKLKGYPIPPNIYDKCSKRAWDGQVRKWRRLLHKFDDVTSFEDCEKVKKIIFEEEKRKKEENRLKRIKAFESQMAAASMTPSNLNVTPLTTSNPANHHPLPTLMMDSTPLHSGNIPSNTSLFARNMGISSNFHPQYPHSPVTPSSSMMTSSVTSSPSKLAGNQGYYKGNRRQNQYSQFNSPPPPHPSHHQTQPTLPFPSLGSHGMRGFNGWTDSDDMDDSSSIYYNVSDYNDND